MNAIDLRYRRPNKFTVFGFCPAGSTSKVDLTRGLGGMFEQLYWGEKTNQMKYVCSALLAFTLMLTVGLCI